MRTWNANEETADRKWWVVDATDLTLGRLATQIAATIRGKNKPTFTPHADMGDFVIVVNAEKIKMTGDKWNTKKYYTHGRHFGSVNEITAGQQLEKDPTQIIRMAVAGMLPKSKQGRRLINSLKPYKGGSHPHASQKPEPMKLIK